ncbi:retrovirus-related pol polyprotein from transposon TNT 1-94 [Tanacetum coccineum]
MSTSNQQTLADSRANERPPMLERGNYIPWESRFRRFLNNNLEGERMWNSIQNRPYVRPMIPNPENTKKQILEPLSKMTEVQFEPHVLVSKAKKAAKNHDPLVLLAHSNASSSQSHANSSYSPQPYYVTHPLLVVDYEDEYQGELQGDLRRQAYNCHDDGRVDIQTKNAGYGGNGNRNAGRQNWNQAFNARTGNDESNQIVQSVPRTESTPGKANVQCYNCNEKGYYARDCPKPRVRDAKYSREQMLLAMKYEAKSVTPRQWRKHKNET